MAADIAAEKLVKRFGAVTAINNVSFSSKRGINMVLGPNGAGKSTLLRCIAGLYRPDRGKVTVLGSDPYSDHGLRRRISFLADNYGLYDFMTVRQNLDFFGRFYGIDGEAVEGVSGLAEELELGQYLDSRVETLSRGTKQKAALCRAMLHDSKILLLDEPTAFLDVKASNTIRSRLQEMGKRNATIVFVTQRIDEVTRFNSRILVLRGGRIAADTNTKGLYGSVLRNAKVSIRLAKPISAGALRSLSNVVALNSERPTIITLRVENYRRISEAISALIERGAYVVGVDYMEPAIDELLFGG